MVTIRLVALLWNGSNIISSVTTVSDLTTANGIMVGPVELLHVTLGMSVSVINIMHVMTRTVNIPLKMIPDGPRREMVRGVATLDFSPTPRLTCT